MTKQQNRHMSMKFFDKFSSLMKKNHNEILQQMFSNLFEQVKTIRFESIEIMNNSDVSLVLSIIDERWQREKKKTFSLLHWSNWIHLDLNIYFCLINRHPYQTGLVMWIKKLDFFFFFFSQWWTSSLVEEERLYTSDRNDRNTTRTIK